jgi:hypothetical protein
MIFGAFGFPNFGFPSFGISHSSNTFCAGLHDDGHPMCSEDTRILADRLCGTK